MEPNAVTTLLLPAALVLIMYGVGLDLRVSDFHRVVWQPRAVVAGTLAQIVFVPLVGLTIAYGAPLPSPLAVGLVIIAACPGGAVSNLISYLARADVALSVSLTAISSITTVVTIPIVVNFALHLFLPGEGVELPMIWTSLKLAALTILPVAAGMTTAIILPELAGRSERPVRALSALFLFIVIIVAVVDHLDELPRYLSVLALPLAILNIATIAIGWGAGRLAGLDDRSRMTLMIETGIQNGALGITIPVVLIGVEEMAIPPALYGVLMLLSGAMLAVVGNAGRRSEEVV